MSTIDVWILSAGESNQIKSNQIESNRIKSNRIKSNQIKGERFKSHIWVNSKEKQTQNDERTYI